MSDQPPPASAGAKDRARELRRRSTDAERLLWHHLRDRRMAGLKFRRQHPIEGFITDFVRVEAYLVIELDGGQHFEPAEQAADARRTAVLQGAGYTVLRFHNGQMPSETDAVLSAVHKRLAGFQPHLNPSTPPIQRADIP